ncbi:hypothetical protein [Streptomyces sp. CB01881]|uniref:hypothetical protein n=1 Tax=Streptomyces sp. CB01881 TaxID=2078691 RepID=UPI000CDCBEDF|nr:hypothetical protein [Streptomyces sp. CB01881]AUY48099.1 hypothetical protein C2142_02960 [Streptomyces sp. CB01881]TYC76584.1 hypothetical protein EH183_02970 [Streptomyces sp. CB01881]
MLARQFARRIDRVQAAVDALELPDAVYKTCPFKPRELVATGLRQWLRCCGAAMLDRQIIGMPSFAVDEAWHGLILCTERYAAFCEAAYGRFLHHHPQGGELPGSAKQAGSMHEQLHRTEVAWSFVARPGEKCVLWDLDVQVGVPEPWGAGAHG